MNAQFKAKWSAPHKNLSEVFGGEVHYDMTLGASFANNYIVLSSGENSYFSQWTYFAVDPRFNMGSPPTTNQTYLASLRTYRRPDESGCAQSLVFARDAKMVCSEWDSGSQTCKVNDLYENDFVISFKSEISADESGKWNSLTLTTTTTDIFKTKEFVESLVLDFIKPDSMVSSSHFIPSCLK